MQDDLAYVADPQAGLYAISLANPAAPLHFVVEPASRIDQWPLRCGLFEQPYLASRLRRSGLPVLTAPLEVDPLGDVPAGLRVGDLILRVDGHVVSRVSEVAYQAQLAGVGRPLELDVLRDDAPLTLTITPSES